MSEALFLKNNSGPKVKIQGKLVIMIKKEDKDIILVVLVTLYNCKVKKW